MLSTLMSRKKTGEGTHLPATTLYFFSGKGAQCAKVNFNLIQSVLI